MFLEFYGLREQPFGMTPDPKYLFWSSSHREALASIYYGIECGRGFVTLIAPPGMGKTTLLYQLQERLRETARTAFLFQTLCGPHQFLRYLMADLGCEASEQDVVVLHEKLNDILIKETHAGRRFVLIIDEAQNLDEQVLETIRLLSDFETPSRKLMQIVMAGQPDLAKKLALPELVQLRQRISILSSLQPLTRSEVAEYIEHRLKVAGYRGTSPFTNEALALITSASQGIPRTVNNLCFNALTLGYAHRRKSIDFSIICEVICDLQLEKPKNPTADPVLSEFSSKTSSIPQIESRALSAIPARPSKLKPSLNMRLAQVPGSRSLGIATLLSLVVLVGWMTIGSVSRTPATKPQPSQHTLASNLDLKSFPAVAEGTDGSDRRTRPNGLNSTRFLAVTAANKEDLQTLSTKHLGRSLDRRLYEEILKLNPGITDPKQIAPGSRVRLPLSLSGTDLRPTAERIPRSPNSAVPVASTQTQRRSQP